VSAVFAVWRLLDRRQKRQLLALMFVSVIMAASTLVGIASLAPFLMVLANPHFIADSAPLSWAYEWLGFSSPRAFLVALAAAFVVMVLISNAINLAGSLAMTRFALSAGDRFHVALFDEYLRRAYPFHVRHGSTALTSNIIYAVNRVTSGLLESALILFANLVAIVTIFASIVYVDPPLAFATGAWVSVAYLIYYLLFRRRLYRGGQLESRRVAERARVAGEGLVAVKEIQVHGVRAFFVTQFARACDAISRTAVGYQVIALAPKHVMEVFIVAGLVMSSLFVSAGRDVGAWLAELAFLGFAAYRLLPAIQQVFAAMVRIRMARAIFEPIAADLDAAVNRREPADAHRHLQQWRDRPSRDIRLDAVSFRYQTDRPPALRDIDLCIPVGAMIGIVGENGAGKTTLVDVLLGVLPPNSGRLLVDGHPVEAQNVAAWQSRLAYVPQQVFMIDGTVAANIALGVPEKEIDRARLIESMRLARIDQFVSELPGGEQAMIGERGLRISGGQRQRIGIARALYRDAPVLVMDEPTSALDGLTEQDVVDVLLALRGSRTIILVAHRMNTVRHCDVIFELHAGMIVARGSWEELRRGSAGFRGLSGVSA
jgi:ATP-binding cassette, subfamily B, bacterial PglK